MISPLLLTCVLCIPSWPVHHFINQPCGKEKWNDNMVLSKMQSKRPCGHYWETTLTTCTYIYIYIYIPTHTIVIMFRVTKTRKIGRTYGRTNSILVDFQSGIRTFILSLCVFFSSLGKYPVILNEELKNPRILKIPG